ncbi:MAG: X-Pro dipeptidyl-peptidase [Cryptosporangiaceae bacterium]|jgi:X-Pro dipeptidyl-peptidase|nr:X-Pro dipeptidyl-peptidase [Cryptosporangiaceae bacterium]
MRLPLAVLAAAATTGLVAGLTAPAQAAPPRRPAPPPEVVVQDGETQPVFPIAQAVTQSVFVQTAVDSDSDGKPDRVHLTITRPGPTDTGMKVASIVELSPYWSGIGDNPNHSVDIGPAPLAPGSGDTLARSSTLLAPSTQEFYVTRGYAYVKAESIGSGQSDGCPTTGDEQETLAGKAVVQWLTGAAKAFDAAGNPVTAGWSAGSVGMMGVSYNGTLPNMVATTGVAGLKTIVPISAISNWYSYYRANGAVLAPGGYQGEDADVLARAVLTRKNPEVCAAKMDAMEAAQDRVTGDYTPFWAQRDYVGKAANVKASVFLTHGLTDWNVKSKQFAVWWDALAKAGVKRKLWLHPGGHGPSSAPAWSDAVHRWIDRYLYDVPNGIDTAPMVTIERSSTSIANYADWPDPAARTTTYSLSPRKLGTSPGTPAIESFTDVGKVITAETLTTNPAADAANRLGYVTTPVSAATRLSGTPSVTLKASVDNATSGTLTAIVADYNPANNQAVIVTRGWIDVRNRNGSAATAPIQKGVQYTYSFELQPKDYVFAAGHQIALVVISTDHDYSLRPDIGTKVSLCLASSALRLPLVPPLPTHH